MAGKSKVSHDRITGAERRIKALKYRKKGLTYYEIGQEMGVCEQRARAMVIQEYERLSKLRTETAEMCLQLELDRLDSLWQALWQKATEFADSRAVEVMLKIMERRSKLLGLDAPAKSEIKIGLAEMSDEELRSEAERLGLPLPQQLSLLTLQPKPEVIDAEFIEKELAPLLAEASVSPATMNEEELGDGDV